MSIITTSAALFAGAALGIGAGAGVATVSNNTDITAATIPPVENGYYQYVATVDRVVDGDTMFVDAKLGMELTRTIDLRFKDIDAPELPTTAGKDSKRVLENMLPVGSTVKIQIPEKPSVYNRYTADVWMKTTAGQIVDVDQYMVDNGYAVHKTYPK